MQPTNGRSGASYVGGKRCERAHRTPSPTKSSTSMTRFANLLNRSRVVAGGIALATGCAVAAAVPSISAAGTSAAPADGLHHYRVTITNLTHGQPLSPPVLVTNFGSGEIFKP